VGQYQIFVGADTKSATSSLKRLDKVVNTVTKARELKIAFPNTKEFQKNVRNATRYASDGFKQLINNADGLKNAFNNVKSASNPRTFLAGSFAGANVGAQSLLDKVAKLSIALYGLNSAASILKGTFGSLFAQTIGQANAFEEQLLKTKTTLASTSDVFIDGKKITDPLKAIEGLTGVIDERIESIRLRTIDIAGVTSGEVVEVFSIVASQAGQIGASLEDAENLAISFAAALGTFGLPLRQARQEITSILQGNVNVDSYLAQALQITNEDISKAKSQIGGIAKFLEDRLQTAVAGQAIAAKTLGGVLSNVRDIWEEFTRAIGTPLLDPLVKAVSVFYNVLGESLAVIKQIGAELGGVVATLGSGLASGAGFGGFDQSQMEGMQQAIGQLLASTEAAFQSLNANIASLFDRIEGQLNTIFGNIAAQVALISDAFGELGKAVLVLTGAQIESFVGAIAQLIPILTSAIAGVSGLIKIWAEFLKLPIVQTFVRFQTTLKVLEATGVKAAVMMTAKIVIFRAAVLKTLQSVWNVIRSALKGIGVVVKAFGGLSVAISRVMRQLAVMGVKLKLISRRAALDIKKMSVEMNGLGVAAKKTGMGMGVLSKGIWGVAGAFKGLLRSTLILAAIELALVAIVEAVSLWQRKQAEAAKQRELQTAIKTLDRTAEAAARGGLTSLDEKLREIAQRKITDQIEQLAEEIAKLDEKLAELDERRNAKDVFLDYSLESDTDRTQAERKKKVQELKELEGKLGKKNAEEEVEVRAKEGKRLEKELAEFRKSLADDEFRYRQRLARAEIDRFRAQSELELRRMEKILAKRLENEEGASRQFLSNLNEYLSTKKRGEDAIAARQQELNVTLANLQKEVADYKYNTEKKIAELQKKMGKFQKEVADYQLKQAQRSEQARSSSGGGGSRTFEGDDMVSQLANAIIGKESGGNSNAMNGSGSGATGLGQVMPENIGPWTEKYLGKRLTQEQFRNDVDAQMTVILGRFKDMLNQSISAGYSDEEAMRRAASEWYSGRPGMHMDTRPQSYNGDPYPSIKAYVDDVMSRVGTTNFTTGGGGQNTSSTDAPQVPDVDLSEIDPSGITSSLEAMAKVLADINALQNELTSEDIASKFESITDQVFGDIQLEPLEDALKKAQSLFQATAESSTAITDAQRGQVEYQTVLNRKTTERDEMLRALNENEMLSAEEKATLEAKITEEYNKHVEKLGEAEAIKKQILANTEATLALEKMRSEIQSIEEATADTMLQMRLENKGLSAIEVNAEIRKARAAREYGRAIKAAQEANNPEQVKILRQEYERLAGAIDKSAKAQMQMADPMRQMMMGWKKELSNVNGMYAQMAQTVTGELAGAMSSAVQGVIDGSTTVEEAMSQMFKNIGQAFIAMATEMIAKALIMKVLGIAMPGAMGGGGTMGGPGYFNPLTGLGSAGPNYGLAEGGVVDGPTTATLGEGGEPEYVIPQSKMDDSMARWNSGSRGESVLDPVTGATGSNGGYTDEMYSPQITINGGVTTMGGEDYIKRSELPSIVGQAAKSGEERALRKLRMSPGARRKIGI